MLFFPLNANAKSHWLTGGLIGGGAGLGVGLAVGLTGKCSDGGQNNVDCDIPRDKITMITAPTFTAIGFGVGALTGSFIKKNEDSAHDGNDASTFMPSVVVDPLTNTYGIGASVNF